MKTFGLAVFFACVFVLQAQAKLIKICFEAESAATVKPALVKVTTGANPAYSGRGFVDIPLAAPVGVGSALYKINVAVPGKYYIFARTFYRIPGGNSISVLVNSKERMLGEDGTYGKWHWIDSRVPVLLKKGTNTIMLTNRETGVRIDQFFLTNDPEYCPVRMPRITHDGGTGKSVAPLSKVIPKRAAR